MKFSAPFRVIEFLGTRLPFAKKFEQLVVLYLKKKEKGGREDLDSSKEGKGRTFQF